MMNTIIQQAQALLQPWQGEPSKRTACLEFSEIHMRQCIITTILP